MDISIAILNLLLMFFLSLLAYVSFRISQKIGYILYWRFVILGFALASISRLLQFAAEFAEIKIFAFSLKDFGLGLYLVGVFFLLSGFCWLLRMFRGAKTNAKNAKGVLNG